MGQHAALVEAAKLARANGEIVAWDCSNQEYAIALYDEEARQLQPLADEEAARLLNRDALIRKAWRKWSAASRNRGSLIVLDAERARRVLSEAPEDSNEDDEDRGPA